METHLISEEFLAQMIKEVGVETMPGLMKAFEKGAKEHIAALKTAIPNTDEGLKKITFHGHALKGMAQSLGLEALGSLGAYLERRGKKLQKQPELDQTAFWRDTAKIIALLDSLLHSSLVCLQDRINNH